MAKRPLPSYGFLHQCLAYDGETGTLIWKPRTADMFVNGQAGVKRWNTNNAGKPASFKFGPLGYRALRITENGRALTYLAHRVIWKLVHGSDPKGDIDHINGDPSDNRIANLRDVPHRRNIQNSARAKNNASGRTGVFWHTRDQRWQACIKIKGQNTYIGSFRDIADAIAARKAAEAANGFHENHGREPIG